MGWLLFFFGAQTCVAFFACGYGYHVEQKLNKRNETLVKRNLWLESGMESVSEALHVKEGN